MLSADERQAGLLRDLIEEGNRVAGLERPHGIDGESWIDDNQAISAWRVRVISALETTFGTGGPHSRELARILQINPHLERAREVRLVIGVLAGGLNDLTGGFLTHQSTLIRADVLDDVLERALDLLNDGHIDCAAVLSRVVLEDAMRQVASQRGVDNTAKFATMNEELRKLGVFSKAEWRLNQAYYDTGSDAAHGNTSGYTKDSVRLMIDGVQSFLARYCS